MTRITMCSRRMKSEVLAMMRTAIVSAAVLTASALTALAEPTTYVSKKFPDDVPCAAFRRDDKGIWHLREGVVISTGTLKITLWSRTINTAEGKSMEARCGSN